MIHQCCKLAVDCKFIYHVVCFLYLVLKGTLIFGWMRNPIALHKTIDRTARTGIIIKRVEVVDDLDRLYR